MGLFDSLTDLVFDLPRRAVKLTGDVVETVVHIPEKTVKVVEDTVDEIDEQLKKL